MLYPLRKYLIANIEPRSDYRTPGDVQWYLNFPIDHSLLYGFTPNYPMGRIDVMVGHPSCGHSSNLSYSRAKKLGDPRKDKSLELWFQCLQAYKPKIFFFENLPKILKQIPIDEFQAKCGDYKLVVHNASVGNFGNSQISRVRLVIIGIKTKHFDKLSSYFQLPDLDLDSLKKTFELESGLNYPDPRLCHVREADDKVVCMEKDFKKLTLAQVKEIWNSKEYKNAKKWDATTTGKGNMTKLPGVYRNLANDFPLTARKQNRQFNSKGEIMSPRELARIQGVPDEFLLWYDPKRPGYCINKARVTATKCPPMDLSYWFKRKLIKIRKHHGNIIH